MAEAPKVMTEVRKFGDEEIEVIFRKAREKGGEGTRFLHPPLLPSVTVENGIRIERDLPVPLRDGTIIYTDVYRPDFKRRNARSESDNDTTSAKLCPASESRDSEFTRNPTATSIITKRKLSEMPIRNAAFTLACGSERSG